jgi:2-oxoglutarate/2-oxoacid ferredoxin oxidoreductase subunit alpha
VVATANGTGSQTANLALLRAFFKMGIPVNGKNIFPSNIQGLPTWYHIRVSKDGYVARRHTSEILVAFNDATVPRHHYFAPRRRLYPQRRLARPAAAR